MNRLLASSLGKAGAVNTRHPTFKNSAIRAPRFHFATNKANDKAKAQSPATATTGSSLQQEWESLAKKEISFEPSKLTWITAEVNLARATHSFPDQNISILYKV